jgi:hypothetical protein
VLRITCMLTGWGDITSCCSKTVPSQTRCRQEWRHGTHECVRHKGSGFGLALIERRGELLEGAGGFGVGELFQKALAVDGGAVLA